MNEQTSAPLSGRRAQAARNDERILEAAREVFVADPEAPISAVAERAGVGISALYRRYASKEDLDCGRSAQTASSATSRRPRRPWRIDGRPLERIHRVHAAHRRRGHALADASPGRDVRTHRGALPASGTAPSGSTSKLLERAQAAGAVRPDLVVDDLSFLFEQLASVRVTDKERTRQLRQRYLALHLQTLHRPRRPPRCQGRRRPGKRSASVGRADARDPAEADAGTRTPDPLLTMEVLYQLSYVGAAESA